MTTDLILKILIAACVAFELTMFIDLLFALTEPDQEDQ